MTGRLCLGDLLSAKQMQECIELYPSAQAIEEKVIRPNLQRFKTKLQQNIGAVELAILIVLLLSESAERVLN